MSRFLAVIITCIGFFLRCQSKTATIVAVIKAKSNSICHGNAVQMTINDTFSCVENLISRGNILLFERKIVFLKSEIFVIIPTKIKPISICKTL